MRMLYAYSIQIDLAVDKHMHNTAIFRQLVSSSSQSTCKNQHYSSLSSRKCVFEYIFLKQLEQTCLADGEPGDRFYSCFSFSIAACSQSRRKLTPSTAAYNENECSKDRPSTTKQRYDTYYLLVLPFSILTLLLTRLDDSNCGWLTQSVSSVASRLLWHAHLLSIDRVAPTWWPFDCLSTPCLLLLRTYLFFQELLASC